MNERVPDSTGLPLRAMVMVLLFLGVIFLLVGFQAMSSSNDTGDASSSPRTLTTTTTSSKPATPKADVRVYSVSGDEPAAARAGDRLREAGWNVTEVATTTPVTEVTKSTVFFGVTAGEEAAAAEVGKVLDARVEPRIPEIADQPPGLIVWITG